MVGRKKYTELGLRVKGGESEAGPFLGDSQGGGTYGGRNEKRTHCLFFSSSSSLLDCPTFRSLVN